jgi:hypothetical protein
MTAKVLQEKAKNNSFAMVDATADIESFTEIAKEEQKDSSFVNVSELEKSNMLADFKD